MAKVDELDLVRKTREQCYAGSRVFRAETGELGVFDPDWARIVNARNFSDLILPDRFVDVLRKRRSCPVSWADLRTDWSACLKRLAGPVGMLPIAERMDGELEQVLNEKIDLNALVQRVTSRALIPTIIDGLPPQDSACVKADQDFKNDRLLQTEPVPGGLGKELRSAWIQMRSGWAVRREIRRRLRDPGRRPGDMTDPVVRRYSDLGMDRAADAVTTVLTAIAGPPGAAAIGLVYCYCEHPEFAERIDAEMRAISLADLVKDPKVSAPFSNQFIKEVLRLWSPPLFMTRPVRTELEVDGHKLKPGQRYTLSLFLVHHDPLSWSAPELFDPDRWQENRRGSSKMRKGAFCPFGWAPKSCIGANMGINQMLIWLHLLATRYRIRPASSERPTLKRAAVILPVEYYGCVVRR
ncbi:MAG: cytochrome P450 [Wenzhouxiangellaceae bacterium]